MSRTFQIISAKPTFGTLQEKVYQSDYIQRKKGKIIYCGTPALCNILRVSNSYDKRNSYNAGRYSYGLEKCGLIATNKYNLVMGQYTKSNLKNVCVVSVGAPPTKYCSNSITELCDPCQTTDEVEIDTSSSAPPFYTANTIDPLGELFGKSQCGELNYTDYMVLQR
jgi:hypothetical protein